MSKPTDNRWLKSGRVDFTGTDKVDADAGILYGVIMCQVGEAKGHGVHLEQEFIDAGIAYAQKHHAKKGMKARFGHPSMSNETLGTEMGRFKNFRVEGDQMVADLHLFESANLSPNNPGMRDWMISQAQEDPEAIMCSIVFSIKQFYQRNSEGEKFEIIWESNGWDGKWVSKDKKNTFDPDSKIYVSLKELMFCDIVDQGAATDKLFSEQFNADKFSVIATQFFNEHPQIDDFIQENPHKIFDFLTNRFEWHPSPESGEGKGVRSETSLMDKFKSLFKKHTNQNQFYMSKIQLGKLSELAVKLLENSATPEDYAAVQTKLSEQGVDVVVLGTSQHATREKKFNELSAAFSAALSALHPDKPAEELSDVNLAEAITTLLTESQNKDQQIADLTAKLSDKGDAPAPVQSDDQQDFSSDEEEPVLSASEKEATELKSIMEQASELSE